jgi:selenocysteine-specific elongation factor
VRTVGGGQILESASRRIKKNQPGLVGELSERSAAVGTIEKFVEYCAKHSPQIIASDDELSIAAKAPKPLLERILAALIADGHVVKVAPALYLHREAAEAAEAKVKGVLTEFHRGAPESPGMTLEDLAAALALDKERMRLLVEFLKSRGAVAERVGRFALPTHRETLPDKEQKLLEAVEAQFRARPFNPPDLDEAATAAGISPADTQRMIKILIDRQVLIRIDNDFVFHGEAVTRARGMLEEFIRREGRLESVKFKYLLDTTRKYALPLLDYFDRIGVTRASGHTRFLRQ